MKMRSRALIALLALALAGLVACGGGKSSNNNNASATNGPMSVASGVAGAVAGAVGTAAGAMGNAANGPVPNCGAVKAVWVNLNSKVYHEPGDPYYGKTKHGEYLCPNQAKAQGFHPAGGAMNEMNGSHHKHAAGSSSDSNSSM